MAEHRPGGGPQKTLERVISKAGLGSRTEARRWIHAGRVTVNGRRTENPDQWIDFDRDVILFDGKPLSARERQYVLLYKPKGYLTTYKDPEGRPTVYDLLGDITTFLSPVGRLDLDTSGLLILTNDTQFAERITNPDSHVPKTYLVKASTRLTDEQLDRLRSGVELIDGPTRAAVVNRVRDSGKYTHLEITLTEGRNRQVRRMIEAIGSHVLKLVRVKIGSVDIGTLPIGKWRPLTDDELTQLGGRPKMHHADAGLPPAAGKSHQRASAQPTRRAPVPAGGRGSKHESKVRESQERNSRAGAENPRDSRARESNSSGSSAHGSAWRENNWRGTSSHGSRWRERGARQPEARGPEPRGSEPRVSGQRVSGPRDSDVRDSARRETARESESRHPVTHSRGAASRPSSWAKRDDTSKHVHGPRQDTRRPRR